MIFYSSDFHINHYNIIKYCNRPFSNIDDMNQFLIDLVNSTLTKNDILIHLGDLFLGNKLKSIMLLNSIKCHLVNIKGNHDCKSDYTIANSLIKYNFANQPVVIFQHKPSNESHHTELFKALNAHVCICGHVHNNRFWKFGNYYAAYDSILDVININIGIDCMNRLVSESELYDIIYFLVSNKKNLPKTFQYRDSSNRHIIK